jgi:hypothetical protein
MFADLECLDAEVKIISAWEMIRDYINFRPKRV